MHTLESAIIRLLRAKPFYGHFILNLRRIELGSANYAAGVTLRNSIACLAVNNELFQALAVVEQQVLLEHLVKHILHLHPLRRNGRYRHNWDIAADLVINQDLRGLPETALLPELFGFENSLAAEEYYSLIESPLRIGNLEGSGYGDGEKDENGAGGKGYADLSKLATMDNHEIWSEAENTSLALAEEMIRSITKDALRGSDGAVPGEIKAVVEQLLKPSAINWQLLLRQFVATAGRSGKKSTWKREHRRFEHITPGAVKHRRLNLLIGVDVSDSTNRAEMREAFAAELLKIASGRETNITVLYANSKIQRIEAFKSSSFTAEIYHGGGFTDLRPVFEYAKNMRTLPAAVIYLTDGIGPAPETMEFPTLWVLAGDGEKPVKWGLELRLDC